MDNWKRKPGVSERMTEVGLAREHCVDEYYTTSFHVKHSLHLRDVRPSCLTGFYHFLNKTIKTQYNKGLY